MISTRMRMGLVAAATAVLAGMSAAVPAQASTSAPASESVTYSGINDFSCKSRPDREPVIMLHGLGAPSGINWFTKAPAIASKGYCVYTPTYGRYAGISGFGSMRDSSKEVAAYVDRVRAATGAEKVNLVGHSEGTTVSAYYMKFDGGQNKVRHFIGFGSNFKGTTLYGLNALIRYFGLGSAVAAVCPACDEFLPPSDFLDDLSRGGITVPGPTYTSIVSRYDQVVRPYTSGVIKEPGVTNITLQDHCFIDLAGHMSQAVDPNVTSLILWSLKGQKGPKPGCVPWLLPG